jgi:hypothetical protein
MRHRQVMLNSYVLICHCCKADGEWVHILRYHQANCFASLLEKAKRDACPKHVGDGKFCHPYILSGLDLRKWRIYPIVLCGWRNFPSPMCFRPASPLAFLTLKRERGDF